jgi:hypothetical protein
MEFSKFKEQAKSSEYFLKKYRAGQICPERAEAKQIQPRSIHGMREAPIQMASKRGPPVSASGRDILRAHSVIDINTACKHVVKELITK